MLVECTAETSMTCMGVCSDSPRFLLIRLHDIRLVFCDRMVAACTDAKSTDDGGDGGCTDAFIAAMVRAPHIHDSIKLCKDSRQPRAVSGFMLDARSARCMIPHVLVCAKFYRAGGFVWAYGLW